MNEAKKDFAQSIAAEQAYARFEKDIQTVKNDMSHLSKQISDAVNALSEVAQNQTSRGVRKARSHVNALISDASDRPHRTRPPRSAMRWRRRWRSARSRPSPLPWASAS